jgi:predicted PurR-regulated permease PerM
MKGRSLVLGQRSHRLWHVSFAVVAVVAVGHALSFLAPVLTPVVAAAAVAYFVDPLVEALARRGLPRALAAGAVLLGFALLVAAALGLLVPLVARDLAQFAYRLPGLFDQAASWVQTRFGLEPLSDWREMVASAGDTLRDAAGKAGMPILNGLLGAVGSVVSFLVALVELLLVPVFAYYFLVDWPRIVARLRGLVPPRHRAEVGAIVTDIDQRVSHWLHGQLTVMAILAVLYAVALSIVGIQLAVPIGVLAGLLTFIPYVGAVVGLSLAVLMALVDWHGPGALIGVGATFGVLHLLESLVLTPKLVGAKVGLGEAGALFAVLAGGHLLGFVGMMLAIPLAASAVVLLRRLLAYYERSPYYTGGAEDQEIIAP